MPRLSVHPHPTVCHRCRALILAALDSPVAGIPVRVDPVPLDAEQELAARLAGRATYNLTGISRMAVVYRDADTITRRTWPVLADHVCPGPIPGDLLDNPAPAPEPGDAPPY